jgi:hypothetical protein
MTVIWELSHPALLVYKGETFFPEKWVTFMQGQLKTLSCSFNVNALFGSNSVFMLSASHFFVCDIIIVIVLYGFILH